MSNLRRNQHSRSGNDSRRYDHRNQSQRHQDTYRRKQVNLATPRKKGSGGLSGATSSGFFGEVAVVEAD
eukprot:g2294.t1